MALLSTCTYCNKEVCHRAGELPVCDDRSGKTQAKLDEQKRWASLTVEQRLDELKARLDSLDERSHWDGLIG